jgi:hypothetical protein
MKKILSFILMLLCLSSFTSCSKFEPVVVEETVMIDMKRALKECIDYKGLVGIKEILYIEDDTIAFIYRRGLDGKSDIVVAGKKFKNYKGENIYIYKDGVCENLYDAYIIGMIDKEYALNLYKINKSYNLMNRKH